ncbi:MAG TPA: site-2 protease family protein, partial [Bryobacteraceae bacterium]|nr:site-2 protease family protein [Bryobacteraceae bacterium]
MGQLSGRRTLLRWAFLGTGYLLLFGNRFVVHRLLMADMWAGPLFGSGSAMYAFLMAAAYFYLIAGWFLCMVTSWGFRRNKPWASAVGLAACVISLPWFPIMTVLGGLGIYFLLSLRERQAVEADTSDRLQRAAARRSKDYWIAQRQSRLQPVIGAMVGISCLVSLGYASRWAIHRGIPGAHWGGFFWGWFCFFGLCQVAIHEFGHAIVAWALYYHVRVVSIGPFLFTHEAKGFHCRFDWRRLLEDSGYTGSIATNPHNARLKHIAVVAAGPAASAISGIVFTVVTLAAPGSSWQSLWWMAATNAVLGIAGTIINLIPVGYSDGTMLLHLIRNTVPGRILLAKDAVAASEEKARDQYERAEFQKQVETARGMLERALEGGESNSMAIAISQQALGRALNAADDWAGAEAAFMHSLAFDTELEASPPLAVNVWSGLVHTRARRFRTIAAGQAYATAVAVIRNRKAGAPSIQRGVSCSMLAQMHSRTLNWQEALVEADEGLKLVPLNQEHLILYAMLLAARAEAHFNLGHHGEGLQAASDAAAVLRAGAMPAARQNLAADGLGDLGEAAWRGGESALGTEFTRDAVAKLEAGGAETAAMAWRIRLIGMLRRSGRFSEAARSLPPEAEMPVHLRRNLLMETAELALLADAASVAVDHARTVVALWQAESVDCAIELAAAHSLLARALLAAGQFTEAETQAAAALHVLKATRHPEAALCLITLAASRHQTSGSWTPEVINEAKASIDSAVLLTSPEKAWWTAEVDRLAKAWWTAEVDRVATAWWTAEVDRVAKGIPLEAAVAAPLEAAMAAPVEAAAAAPVEAAVAAPLEATAAAPVEAAVAAPLEATAAAPVEA